MSFNRNETLKLGKGADHMVESSVIDKMKKSFRKHKNRNQSPEKFPSSELSNIHQ
jgi:hypothetical protein